MKFLLLFLLTTKLVNVYAETPKTHMLIMGGSGDPAGPTTIFDTALEQMGDLYTQKKEKGEIGQVSVAFNGGHRLTDIIKTDKFSSAEKIQNFTPQTYQQEINRFKTMMTNNAVIKPGEQLLIYIDSHGAAKESTSKTHFITSGDKAITNYENASGSSRVNLDQIDELKRIAKNNGIKLAIIDLSCHSGNTQALADQNTCVISATGKNHYSYSGSGFGDKFSKNIRPGDNLESVFLKARSEDATQEFPLISTPEGKLIEEQLYTLLTPYLYFEDGKAEKLTNDLIKSAIDPQYACTKNSAFSSLNELLDQIEKNTTVTKKAFIFESKESITNFSELKKTLQEYKYIQDQLTDQLKAMRLDRLKKMEQVDSSNSFSWEELLSTDWEEWIESSERQIASSEGAEREGYEFNKSVFEKANAAKQRILRENPALLNYKNIVTNFDRNLNITKDFASRIASLEKKLFDGLYKHYAKGNQQSNPCRDFTL